MIFWKEGVFNILWFFSSQKMIFFYYDCFPDNDFPSFSNSWHSGSSSPRSVPDYFLTAAAVNKIGLTRHQTPLPIHKHFVTKYKIQNVIDTPAKSKRSPSLGEVKKQLIIFSFG